MRMRKKKNLLPRMERCGAYQIKDPYEHKGRWHDLMPEAKEIRVELGCDLKNPDFCLTLGILLRAELQQKRITQPKP